MISTCTRFPGRKFIRMDMGKRGRNDALFANKKKRTDQSIFTDSILINIFLFILLSDFRSMALTCKRFRDLSMERLRYALEHEKRAVGDYLESCIRECVNTGRYLTINHLLRIDTFDVGFHMKDLYEYQLKTGDIGISMELFKLGRLNMKISKFVCGCLVLLMKNYKGLVIELITQAKVLGDGHVNWNYPTYGSYPIIASYHHEEILRLCLQEGRAIMTKDDRDLIRSDLFRFGNIELVSSFQNYLEDRKQIIKNELAHGNLYDKFCPHTGYECSILYQFGGSCNCERPVVQK